MYALGFGIGNYGYVGTGYNDNYLKDFYQFDPSAASGSRGTIINGFGGQKRQGGMVFVIDDIAYICGGETIMRTFMISGVSTLHKAHPGNSCGILKIQATMITMMIIPRLYVVMDVLL